MNFIEQLILDSSLYILGIIRTILFQKKSERNYIVVCVIVNTLFNLGGLQGYIFLVVEIKKQNKTCLPNCSCLLFIRILPRQDLRYNKRKITGEKHTPEITFQRVNQNWYFNLFVGRCL